jgi:hypothetical protein
MSIGIEKMAKLIMRTPDLEGKEADRFMEMYKELNLDPKVETVLKKCVETYKTHKK